jgi:acetoacetyl-CoA synthetase
VTSQQPDPIWVPTGQDIAAAGITAFAEQAAAARGYRGESYLDLWRWSVEQLDDFWAAVWDHFDVRSPTPYRAVRDGAMPSVRWFDGAQVSYVEHLFRDRPDDAVAIVDVAESAAAGLRVRRLTWAQLRAEVVAVAALLQQLGVSPGDRVAAYVPNTVEAVVGFLAAAALGAVWSACGQDYGPGAAAQRLAQLEPIVLIAADGYRYGGRDHDRRVAVAELRRALPNVRATVVYNRLHPDAAWPDDVTPWPTARAGQHLGPAAASPRHVPDDIIEVAAVPHTLTGKKLEIPIKRILLGQRPEDVVDLEAVDRPDVLADLAALAPAGSPS